MKVFVLTVGHLVRPAFIRWALHLAELLCRRESHLPLSPGCGAWTVCTGRGWKNAILSGNLLPWSSFQGHREGLYVFHLAGSRTSDRNIFVKDVCPPLFTVLVLVFFQIWNCCYNKYNLIIVKRWLCWMYLFIFSEPIKCPFFEQQP